MTPENLSPPDADDSSRALGEILKALRESEERYRSLVAATSQVVWVTDAAGEVEDIPQWRDLTGQSPEEVRGRGWLDALHPEDRERVAHVWAAAVRARALYSTEYRVRVKDGSYRHFAARGVPVTEEGGRIREWVGTCTDITERKRAEGLLHEGEQSALASYQQLLERLVHLAQALGTAPDLPTMFRALRDFAVVSVPCIGIFISLYDPEREVRTAVYAWGDGEEVDVSTLPPMPITSEGPNSRAVRTGQIVFTNDYLRVQHGVPVVPVGEPNGRLPRSSMVVPMAVMGRTVGTIEVQSYELAAYTQEHAAAVSMAANLAAIAIENARLFERETRARAVAEESNRLKDEFLATLSHELRTPLTAILGWTGLLRGEQLDEAAARRALEIIERNAQSQKQLIDDLLEVSRIITGKFRLDLRPVNLASVIEAAADAVRPAAAAKNIRLDTSISPRARIVSGDPDRLQQVVWNLLSNAVKFTPAGGRVQARLDYPGEYARISVTDTGQGISAEFLPHVFDRFRQADSSTTRAHGGLGLGLSIVRHLVELHGGTARAESAGEGTGATFVIDLPLIPIEQTGAADEGADETATSLEGLRVLLVEDEPDTSDFLARVLRRYGAEVIEAASTREALTALARTRPDVLLCDIGMQGEDGYALIRRVRALEAQSNERLLPAAALTAYASSEDRARAFLAGFQAHVPKPVEPATLLAVVADLARRARR